MVIEYIYLIKKDIKIFNMIVILDTCIITI